jgi:hypothetical protein
VSWRATGWLLLLSACGRVAFDPHDDAAGGARTDGIQDATPRCSWSAGPLFGTVTPHPELDSTENESDPFLMRGDPTTIHFSSHRDGTYDVFEAHRSAVGALFDPPLKRTDLSTGSSSELGVVMDADGSHGWISVDLANNSIVDVYEVSGTPGALAIGRRVSEIDDALGGLHVDFWPAPDELSAIFSAGPGGAQQVYSTTRPDTSSPWGSFQLLPLGSPNLAGATMTADGRTLVYCDSQGPSPALYYRVRASSSDAFGPAVPLTALNTAPVQEPSISEDGCELFYSLGPITNWDIVSVDILP